MSYLDLDAGYAITTNGEGRLGGLQSSDTANDAAVKRHIERIVGSGASLNPAP